MWYVWISLVHEYDRQNGHRRSRGYKYYSAAAVKAMAKWKRLIDRDSVPSLEARNLLLPSLEPDQIALVQIREMTTSRAIIKLMKSLYPIYAISADLMYELSEADDLSGLNKVTRAIDKAQIVPKRIRERLRKYLAALRQFTGSME